MTEVEKTIKANKVNIFKNRVFIDLLLVYFVLQQHRGIAIPRG